MTSAAQTVAPPPGRPSTPGASGCSLQGPFESTPAAIADALDPVLLASYAILRRPAAAADQPPPINSLAEQVGFELGGYNPAYIRQVTQRSGGRRFYVIPGFPARNRIPPARCLPPELRPKRPELVRDELARRREPIACLATISPNAGLGAGSGGVYGYASYGGGACPAFRDLTTYDSLSTAGGLQSSEHAGILPDDIATVRVHFARAPVVEVPVLENVYFYKVASAPRERLLGRISRMLERLARHDRARTRAQRDRLISQLAALTRRAEVELTPASIELIGADGQVVKTVRRPKRPVSGLGLGGFGSGEATVPAPAAVSTAVAVGSG